MFFGVKGVYIQKGKYTMAFPQVVCLRDASWIIYSRPVYMYASQGHVGVGYARWITNHQLWRRMKLK